jgi:hypothetical protein
MTDSGTANSVDFGLTKADIYGPRVAANPQPTPAPTPDNGPIKTAKLSPRKPDWWELRINLRSMSEYDAIKQERKV